MTAGILPLDGEMELDAGRYPPDRMFVTRRCASEPAAGVDALGAAGHPASAIRSRAQHRHLSAGDRYRCGRAVMRINPFDHPSVESASQRPQHSGRLPAKPACFRTARPT